MIFRFMFSGALFIYHIWYMLRRNTKKYCNILQVFSAFIVFYVEVNKNLLCREFKIIKYIYRRLTYLLYLKGLHLRSTDSSSSSVCVWLVCLIKKLSSEIFLFVLYIHNYKRNI